MQTGQVRVRLSLHGYSATLISVPSWVYCTVRNAVSSRRMHYVVVPTVLGGGGRKSASRRVYGIFLSPTDRQDVHTIRYAYDTCHERRLLIQLACPDYNLGMTNQDLVTGLKIVKRSPIAPSPIMTLILGILYQQVTRKKSSDESNHDKNTLLSRFFWRL